MAKTQALGTKLYVEDAESPGDFIPVGNITSLPIPGPEKPEIDVTDFDSIGAESLPGLPDYGELSFSGFFNAENDGQLQMFTDAQDPDAPVRAFRIDMTRQNIRFSFNGYVRSFRPNAGGPNEAITFDGSIRVTGSVTHTTPIPAP